MEHQRPLPVTVAKRREAKSSDGFALLDHELRFREVNASLAAINGVAVDEHLGRTVAEVLPQLAPTLEPLLRQVLATGEPVIDIELRGALVANNTPQRWLASYYPVRSRGGSVVAIDAVVRALPTWPEPHIEPESLERLRERERFAASVAEASPCLIYVYDFDTNRNLYTNSRLTALFGYSRAELDAMGPGFLFRLIHPDDIPLALEQVFVNLLTNAVKYSPAGGSIRVWMEPQVGQVQIHVQDQGSIFTVCLPTGPA